MQYQDTLPFVGGPFFALKKIVRLVDSGWRRST